MSFLSNWFGRVKGIDYYENSQYESNHVGSIQIPDSLKDDNAFTLANTVSELYYPIDFYADRAGKLRYYIADKNGIEQPTSPYNRFLKSINPIYGFADLVYQYVFSYMSDGNGISYITVPSSFKTINPDSISRMDILQPDLVFIDEYTGISTLAISSLNDLIKRVRYDDNTLQTNYLDISRIRIDTLDQTRRAYSNVLCKSPLYKAKRNVDNLLATYSARYNVYVNNGSAGYLVKKSTSANNLSEIVDPTTRQTILDDINQRNGITGRRNFWGISSVPLEFINTLADIQKLMPFEETLENAIKIASVYQIPPELAPRKDQTTFNNKSEAERSVWENGIMSIVQVVCENFTKALYLDKVGVQIMADYSTVSSLKQDKKVQAEADKAVIDNQLALYEKGIITYNSFLLAIGQESVSDGDNYIYDRTKVPYAVKLGVGGTQAMQMLLSDPNLDGATKRNALIVIFGLSEQEASQIIT
jgi:hypothetical protein